MTRIQRRRITKWKMKKRPRMHINELMRRILK